MAAIGQMQPCGFAWRKSEMSWLDKIDRVNEIVGRIVSFMVPIIIAITVYEVFLRYVFNSPTVWVHETSDHLFAFSFLLGGAYTFSQGGHVKVDVLYNHFSERNKLILEVCTSFFFFLFLGLLLWKGGEMAWESVRLLERSQTPWGPYVFHVYLAVPIAAFLMLLQGLAFLIRDVRKLREVGK
jgi:TRAP-type mannitol/chloroaromatic compound transport system permease small subunit